VKYADIPNKVKAWGAAFLTAVAVGTTIFVWVSYLHTDAEAAIHVADFESYQAQQLESDKRKRVDTVQSQIDRYDYQLLDVDLPQVKRDYLTHKRADLVEKIGCIREDNC
jgi:hypothetical protein